MRMHDLLRPRLLLVALPVLAVVVLAACGSTSGSGGTSGTPTAMPTSAQGSGGAVGAATVSIANYAYSPSMVTVKVGATVTWTNKDSVPHDVVSTDGPGVNAATTAVFKSKYLDQGQSFSFTFTKAGTYFYECTIHKAMPSMHAQVVVK